MSTDGYAKVQRPKYSIIFLTIHFNKQIKLNFCNALFVFKIEKCLYEN